MVALCTLIWHCYQNFDGSFTGLAYFLFLGHLYTVRFRYLVVRVTPDRSLQSSPCYNLRGLVAFRGQREDGCPLASVLTVGVESKKSRLLLPLVGTPRYAEGKSMSKRL